ncbi:hypothetical protein PV325_010761 [Microctonus aethiopoides]|nr:hypothetical protein PV325_010761 [Microctonus aethiopoides]
MLMVMVRRRIRQRRRNDNYDDGDSRDFLLVGVHERPDTLYSPTWILNNQRGNCFEFSTLLLSLLRGQNYNAFIVSGYASREQTLYDTSKVDCPYFTKSETIVPVVDTKTEKKYCLKPPPNFTSKLLLNLEEEKNKIAQDEEDRKEKDRKKNVIEQERLDCDEYWGYRVHSWIVVLPEAVGAHHQEITSPFFIEPTSGQHYFLDNDDVNRLYHGIESIWNEENYWVNMQMCTGGCNNINWKLNDNKLWEHLLPGEPWTMRDVEETNEDKYVNIQQDKHLDMPSSYVAQIEIHSLDYERRFPNGRKTMLFKKTRVELYAPYIQMDGLIEKITVYDDYKYESPRDIFEKYSNRGDNLIKSTKHLDSGLVVDLYNRGRTDALKKHCYSSIGDDCVEDERTVEFYDVVRIDGLSKVELHPSYFTQYFVGRKDLLNYRNVLFTTENGDVVFKDNQRQVWKITEEFGRNKKLPPTKDIAIREFCIGENEIRLKYHYKDDEITRVSRVFIKPPDTERGDRLVFDPQMTYGYNPDSLALPEKSVDLFYLLENQLKEEEQSLAQVRDTERMIISLLKTRSTEYGLPRLSVSMFDRNRNDEAKTGMLAQEELLRAQSKREIEKEVDYLEPYLARLGNPKKLTKAQALQIRDECLNDFKQSIINRANNIWRKFEEKRRKLDELQRHLAKSDNLSKEEEERIVNETNTVNFEMHTLDVKLKRHCDLSEIRYQERAVTLRNDKRLSSLL